MFKWFSTIFSMGAPEFFFVPYYQYTIVKEVYCLKKLSVSGKYFSGTKKVKLLADCQFNEPSTL